MRKRTVRLALSTLPEDFERLKDKIVEELEQLNMKRITADDRAIRFTTGPLKNGHPVTFLDSGLIEFDSRSKTLSYRIRYWWPLSSVLAAWCFVYFVILTFPEIGFYMVPVMGVATAVFTPLLMRFFNRGFTRFVAECAEKANVLFDTRHTRL